MQSLNRYDDLIEKSSLFMDKQKQIGDLFLFSGIKEAFRKDIFMTEVIA